VNRTLMRVIVDLVVFLAQGEDEPLHPDEVVTELENTSALLQELTQEELTEFTEYIEELALTEQARRGNGQLVEILRELSDNLGLGNT
jgi:Cdc6-like AAA superfamily ATPase